MIEFFHKLFNTDDFPARWDCGDWTSGHGWLHILSDLAIFFAYVAIPIVLLLFAWKKHKEILHIRLIWLFAAFILTCGFTHFIEASIFWNPVYRFSGLVKMITAVISWVTVLALIRGMPSALKLPGIIKVNNRLAETVTELESSNEDLKQSNSDLDQFAYIASHDLKSPLRSIGVLTSWISEDCEAVLPKKSLDHFNQLKGRVTRMENLLNDLLLYSKLGHENTTPETVDSCELVEAIIHHSFRDIHPEMDFEVIQPMPKIETLRIPLEHCLHNLISNAIKHHDRKDGTIKIASRTENGFIEISVEDDGPGIPLKFQERIFEIFETLKPRDEVEGSGMGLAIVRRLATRLGGEIMLESEPGAGSKFTFRTPLNQKIPLRPQNPPLRPTK